MNTTTRLPLLLLAFLLVGCGTIQEGSEKFVVRTEQAQAMALDAVDAFLLFEDSNSDTLWKLDPGIKYAADSLRTTWPAADASATRALRAYKRNRTADNKVTVQTAIAVLEQLKTEAQTWLVKSQPSN